MVSVYFVKIIKWSQAQPCATLERTFSVEEHLSFTTHVGFYIQLKDNYRAKVEVAGVC